ncbi:MAG: trigger factor [Spirochaetaceae bacterium]|nr:trigger factor [Spirochaetaceae bacterium]
MNVTHEITKLEHSAVKLTITIPQGDVAAAYEGFVKKFAKTAQIPGFRKGHVPVQVLERKYGRDLTNEALAELVDGAFKEVEEKIDEKPYYFSTPQLEGAFEPDITRDLRVSFTYDVFPDTPVPDLSKISITEPQVTVTEEDVQEELRVIQKRNALVVDKNPGEAAAKGDIVTITWHEVDGEGRETGGQEGFVLTAGAGANRFGFDGEVVGMKAGDAKEVSKTFGDDSGPELAGTTKKFTLKVEKVQVEDVPPIDDELAQDVSEQFKTLEDLKADVVKRLEASKTARIEELKRKALVDALAEQNSFDIPESMIQADMDVKKRNFLAQSGIKEAETAQFPGGDGKINEILAQQRPEIEKQLRGQLLTQKLLEEKKIEAGADEIEGEFQRYAADTGVNLEELRGYYKPGTRAYEYFVDSIKEKKLFTELFSQIKIEKGKPITLKELYDHDRIHE